MVAERPLSGRASVVATARTRDGVALLLARPGRRSGARLVLVAAARTRTISLPSLNTLPRLLDKSMLGSAIGLAVDREIRHAYLVEPEGRVIDVDLARGKFSAHALPLRRPAAAAKGIFTSIVQALSLGRGLLAVTGIRRTPSGGLVPLGLRLVDTRSWRSRLLDPGATGIASAGTTLLAFQPFFDQLGAGITAIGLRGYSLSGSIRFRALAGEPVVAATAEGRYAYAAGLGSGGTSVIDLRDGHVEAPDPAAMSISPFELLAGAGP